MGTIVSLFLTLFALFFFIMLRAGRLEKGSKISSILMKLTMIAILVLMLYIVFFNKSLASVFTAIDIVLGTQGIAIAIGKYGLNKKHTKQVRAVLALDSLFIIFFDVFLSNLNEPLPGFWINVVIIVQFALIIQNFKIWSILLRLRGNYYKFIKIHGISYMVYNEHPILYGQNDSRYKVVKIPVVGDINLGEKCFIRDGDSDTENYVIKIGLETFEIRNDFEIQVEESNGINFLVVTINETPIVSDADKINILSWCGRRKKARHIVELFFVSKFFIVS